MGVNNIVVVSLAEHKRAFVDWLIEDSELFVLNSQMSPLVYCAFRADFLNFSLSDPCRTLVVYGSVFLQECVSNR